MDIFYSVGGLVQNSRRWSTVGVQYIRAGRTEVGDVWAHGGVMGFFPIFAESAIELFLLLEIRNA